MNTAATAGQPVVVPVEITSLGNEISLSFSLAFDQALLGVPTSALTLEVSPLILSVAACLMSFLLRYW